MGTRSEPEQLLTIEQAAKLSNYDAATVRRWMDRGLPFVAAGEGKKRPREKDVRIRASDLWRWIEGLIVTRNPEEKPAARGKATSRSAGSGGLSAWRQSRGVK